MGPNKMWSLFQANSGAWNGAVVRCFEAGLIKVLGDNVQPPSNTYQCVQGQAGAQFNQDHLSTRGILSFLFFSSCVPQSCLDQVRSLSRRLSLFCGLSSSFRFWSYNFYPLPTNACVFVMFSSTLLLLATTVAVVAQQSVIPVYKPGLEFWQVYLVGDAVTLEWDAQKGSGLRDIWITPHNLAELPFRRMLFCKLRSIVRPSYNHVCKFLASKR